MSLVTALAVSIGVMGGIACFLVLGPLLMLHLHIWAFFIAWGCYYHTGGKEAGLRNTIVNTVFGVIVAWVTLLVVVYVPLSSAIGLPLWAGICVGAGVFLLVLAAHIPALAVIPAGVYGFAATAAFALVGNHLNTLASVTMLNPLLGVGISMIVGAVLGYISEKVAGSLTASAPAKTA